MAKVDNTDLMAAKAAHAFMGEFAWPTVLMSIVFTASFIAIPIVASAGCLSLWLAIVLMGLTVYASYTVLHESVHRAISGNKKSLLWLNEWCGYLAGFVLFIPLTAHRKSHFAHHAHTNDQVEDPDLIVTRMTQSPAAAARAVWQVIGYQYGYYFRRCWKTGSKQQNTLFCTELAIGVIGRVALVSLTDPLTTIALLIGGGAIGTLIVTYFFAYIVHEPHSETGRYTDTSTLIVDGIPGKVVNWLWLFQNYHSIHHLFPRVPFYRYVEVYENILPVMAEKQAPMFKLSLTGMKQISGKQIHT